MILVDTSVWIEHLRLGSPDLTQLLESGDVLCHPYVVGELACGNLRNRKEILVMLRALPLAEVAGDEEVLHLLESERMYGQGLGWIDAHLLASVRLTNCALWTLDDALRRAARRMKLASKSTSENGEQE